MVKKSKSKLVALLVSISYILSGFLGGFILLIVIGTTFFNVRSNYSITSTFLLTVTWLIIGPLLSIFSLDLIFKKFTKTTKIFLVIISGIMIYLFMNSNLAINF
jgi:uncharacterized membrane protein YbhN (UPF0104 family)